MMKVFRAASSKTIPGDDLFHEHLHPTFDGYRLMAQAFFESLYQLEVATVNRTAAYRDALLLKDHLNKILDQYLKADGGVTDLDLEYGELKNYMLTHHWPFANSKVDFEKYNPVGTELTKSLVLRRVRENLWWDGSHYELAKHYIESEKYQKAFEEYRAVNLAFYDNPTPFIKIGDLFASQNLHKRAVLWYRRGVEQNPDNLILLTKLSTTLTITNQFPEAIEVIQKTFKVDSSNAVLDSTKKAALFYYLGVSNANLKKWPEANQAIDEALSLKPEFEPALKLKAQIQKYRNRQESSLN
ncbi:hypothetical protein GWN91_00190 [Candidatus Saccharibacteria bacterium]|nr:hypothetical protein [Candidatus Saccharibacteria bacterium]